MVVHLSHAHTHTHTVCFMPLLFQNSLNTRTREAAGRRRNKITRNAKQCNAHPIFFSWEEFDFSGGSVIFRVVTICLNLLIDTETQSRGLLRFSSEMAQIAFIKLDLNHFVLWTAKVIHKLPSSSWFSAGCSSPPPGRETPRYVHQECSCKLVPVSGWLVQSFTRALLVLFWLIQTGLYVTHNTSCLITPYCFHLSQHGGVGFLRCQVYMFLLSDTTLRLHFWWP